MTMSPIDHCKKFGIGLTGGIATGKSTVANMIRNQGFKVYDADRISREVVSAGSEGLAAVIEKFGHAVLDANNNLDRDAMRQIIFSQPEKKKMLEEIIHPLIQKSLHEKLLTSGLLHQNRAWFYEASLLFEAKKHTNFSAIWCTLCPEAIQIERLCARDQISEAAAKLALQNQLPAQEKAKLSDLTINTDVSILEIEAQVTSLLSKLA